MSESGPVVVTVFGLGEAGSLISAGLAAKGAEVHAFDPADVETPVGVVRHDLPADAVQGAVMVMAITAASDAQAAIAQAWDKMARGTIYADLSTAPPLFKEDLSDTAALRGLPFADVALMAPVPGRGLATPSLVSGSGAEPYAEIVNGFGGIVEVVGEDPGEAASRKLLRSVVIKGLASSLIEALEGAGKLGLEEWFWEHIVAQFENADRALLERLVVATGTHAERRVVEMQSAAAMLESVGVEAIISKATEQAIARSGERGVPDFPDPPTGE